MENGSNLRILSVCFFSFSFLLFSANILLLLKRPILVHLLVLIKHIQNCNAVSLYFCIVADTNIYSPFMDIFYPITSFKKKYDAALHCKYHIYNR